MITNLSIWWHSKSATKKSNWMLLALASCIIASGFVESGFWWPVLAGIVPGLFILVMEWKG